ncbi:STY4851/ECs_5259 family protein [Shewanella xiamenensis]|uniref:STY4851/ECs_5259 family protein n=1 Tax=Shewanella xiamenensis TaxID=332186 RepID=UPI00313CDC9A
MLISCSPALISVSSWQKSFLTRRGLTTPSGIPLYQYQVTLAEYAQLRDILTESFRFGAPNKLSPDWCGAFTLYCAEWFRREYNLDWSWLPIFESLDMELSQNQKSEVVRSGLTCFWKRSLSHYIDRCDYLGSVFKEGGLPSKLLSLDSNNYQTAFAAIFNRYQQIKDWGTEAVNELIRSRISRLPENLKGEESVELIASMVKKLDSLVYQFGLERQSQPAAYLDEHFPQWRNGFPLPLESEIGSAFLSQLLVGASKAVQKVVTKRKELACRHFLSFDNQSISTEIIFPINCRFNLSKLQLSSGRIELALFEGDKQIAALGPAFVQFEHDQTLVRIRTVSTMIRRHRPESELYLVAMQAGQRLSDIRLEDSALDIGEVPITLVEDAGRWRVLGQASITTKREDVHLLFPFFSELKLIYGHWEHGVDGLKYRDLTLTKLNGRCEVYTSGSERFVITTGTEDLTYGSFVVKGEQLNWKTTPAMVFLGIPTIKDKESYEICTQNSVYLGDKLANTLISSQMHGRHSLSLKTADGVTLLRKRVGILPSDFEIKLIAGQTPDLGMIQISTAMPCLVNILSEAVNIDSQKKLNSVIEISLSAKDLPPASVRLEVTASLSSEPIYIEVPFPAKGALAFDSQGQQLKRLLSVEELLGAKLHLFASQGCPTNFLLEVVSQTSTSLMRAPYFRKQYKVVDQPVQISLYGLRDSILALLSTNDTLDARVELTVSGPGRTLRYQISRYSMVLEHDNQHNTVYPLTVRGFECDTLKPVLMNLGNPEQKPLLLKSRQSEGVDTGIYELPRLLEDVGPWLVVPQDNNSTRFRAKFIPCKTEGCISQELTSLQKAARIYHPRNVPDAISIVLSQMANDWSHSGWMYLKATYSNYGYLPLSTFEVWRHLIRNPKALAVAIFRFECDEKFVSQLESELPVIWELIELADWCQAICLMRESFIKAGFSEGVLEGIISGLISRLALQIPVLEGNIAEFMKRRIKPALLPTQVMEEMIDDWYRGLLAQQSENTQWPEELSGQLLECCSGIKNMPFEIRAEMPHHRGVVYAPIYAAAVASGLLKQNECIQLSDEVVFHIRQLRDFDRDWFEPTYRYFVSYFCNHCSEVR